MDSQLLQPLEVAEELRVQTLLATQLTQAELAVLES